MNSDSATGIAIMGLTELESLAVRTIVDSLATVTIRSFASPEETLSVSGVEWRYVVSPMTVVANFEFFIPRRQKTLVLHDGLGSVGEGGIICVSSSGGVAAIELALQQLLEPDGDAPDQQPALSQRETEVLKEIARGKTNKEIADTLCISVNTVNSHRKNISAKLGIRSASALSLYALMNGII